MQPKQKLIAKIDGFGRPPIIEEKLPLVLEGIRKVLIMRHVASYAQIHFTTLFGWMRRGREDIAAGNWTVHANFFYQVKRTQADEIELMLTKIKDGVERWQSNAWILERCYRDDFGSDAGIIRELMDKAESLQEQFNELTNKVNKDVNNPVSDIPE